jgi:uncharacterized protein YjbI with pentapeptide repeats
MSAGLLTACSGGGGNGSQATPSPTEPPVMASNVTTFEKNPNVDTWDPVHQDLQKGVTPKSESRIIEILAIKNVDPRIVNAAAVDLTSADFVGAMRAVHALNVTSQIDPPANAATIVRRTSWLAWIFLALRSVYDRSGIDVTHMDLRTGGTFVGQNMNLRNVDFSGATLNGGIWHGDDLTDANFGSARVMAPFMCVDCTWGPVRATLKFSDGRWITP